MSNGFASPPFLAISPFGPYCQECAVPLAVEKGIYSHGKTSHDVSVKNAALVREVKARILELRRSHSSDLSSYLVPGSSFREMWFCTCCFVAFSKQGNYKRHFESRCNTECVDVGETKSFCYPTICGRFGPKTCKKIPLSVESPTLVTDATTISSLSQSGMASIVDVISCGSRVPAALMTTLDEASEILKPFVRLDEDVNVLSLIYFPLLSRGFEGTMRQYLEFSTKQKNEDPILTQWIKAGQLWLTNYASGHIANVSANVRHRLAEFEQQEVDGTTYGTRTFTLRRGIPRLVGELEAALRFFYRFPTSLFNDFKTEAIEKATMNWMIERAVIPRILFVAAKEEPTDHGQLPVACRYCLSRGFTIKNQVQLVMNDCGWFSSRISAFMHLLRAGVCGYLVTLSVEQSQELTSLELEVVRSIQNGRVTNLLAPYVKRLRELDARKPPIKNNTVNANGDITSGAFTFPKSTWSTIIPRIVHLAKTCLAEVFQGNSWEHFLVLPVRVADWVGLEACVETPDATISLMDLSLKENIESSLSLLQAIAEFCLFGLGVGAVRHEEVVRLKVRSFQWHNSYLYYWTESLKQGALRGDKKPRLIEHRLSLSLSPIFLLLRYSFVASGSIVSDDLLPQLPGVSMLTLVRDIFDFDATPMMLNVRHFFTSVGNILLPENKSSGYDTTLVSNISLTEKSGHTQGTGRRAYGTQFENSDEMLYDMYHQSLGEVSVDPPVIAFTPYSDSVLSAALKELLGVHADYRSRQQKMMVDIASNSITRHSYVGIPCGHGKSLSWFVPTMASYLAGRHVGLRIVILPYKFLLGHMVHQARSMFGLLVDRLRVEFLDSSNMEEETLLPILQGDGIPSILFTNLDGASTFLRLHMTRLQKLASTNILKRVYVDEFQQLISEFGFRSAYQSLRELGRIGSPVMCLSGSMPLSIAMSLMSYCRLVVGDQPDAMDIVQGFDPIGSGFHFDVQVAPELDSAIASFVLKSTETACHIICDTKLLVENVAKRLSNYCNVLTVTGDTPSYEQMKCAEQWSTGRYDVLVSTVVALVGNENKRCRKIVVGGFLFNLSSLVQAIGRLRPDQRGQGSSVVVFRSGLYKKLRDEAKSTEQDAFSELVRAQCLQETSREEYSRVFSPVGLQEVLSMKTGCYLQTMSHFYGYARPQCGTCGLCLKSSQSTIRDTTSLLPDATISSPTKRGVLGDVVGSSASSKRSKGTRVDNVQLAKSRSIESSSAERSVKRIADCVLHELLYRCIICGRASCNGECVNGCFRCGDKYHKSAICSFDFTKLTMILPHKGVCFGCFDTRLRGMEKHDVKECPFRRRLRGMLFLDRRRTDRPFDLYLKSLYTDEMSFLSMVASFSARTTLGRIVIGHRKVKQHTLDCLQVAFDSSSAPLLPPDFIHNSKDLSVDGITRSVTFKNAATARSRYQELSLEKSSVLRRRKFVYGALYKNLFEGYHEIDPMDGDVDLLVSLSNKKQSVVQIKMVSPDSGIRDQNLLQTGISLGWALGLRGNARGGKVGDLGCMHALGYRSASTKFLYVMDEEISKKVEQLSRPMRDWMEDHMKDTLKDLIRVDKELKVAYTLSCMPTGPGSRMMVSVNLANAAHVDVDDSSLSVALWLEERPGQAMNWYFILPNLTYKGSSGVVVKLRHGTVISWDAREIFHCTSKTEVGDDNRVYGCMWGSANG